MKTRFADLLKVKKQKMTEVEQQLLDVQNRKKRLEHHIEKIDHDIAILKLPQSGDFGIMQVSRQTFTGLMEEKNHLNEKLLVRQKQIEGLKVLHQEMTLEYEKVAYLDDDEMKKVLKRLQKEESKALDEIANILFVNQQEKADA